MFSTPKKNDGSYGGDAGSGNNVTIIARGVRVEGEFTSQGDVLIEGEVLGHVTTQGTLTVGSEAKLKADVSANEASVAGLIEGNVSVKKRLELKSSAKIIGDVTCETAAVESGAVLNGRATIGPVGKPQEVASAPKVMSQTSISANSVAVK